MKPEKEKMNPIYSLTAFLHQRVSLTLKVIVLTVVVGISLWALLDQLQSSKLKKVFYVQLVDELTEEAMIDRLSLDRYIKSHHKLAKLLVAQENLINYIEKQVWHVDDNIEIKYYDRTPPWYPKVSALRIFAAPRYALLLDQNGNVMELYMSRHNYQPTALLSQITPLSLAKSYGQSLVTSLNGLPYVIASRPLKKSDGSLKATLMLASPIDEEFLISSLGALTPGHLIALASQDDDPKILTSSNLREIAKGTSLSTLEDKYLITGQQFIDYGAAEYVIKLISFIPVKEVDKITNEVIRIGRQQRNIIAPAFILIFASIMFSLSTRINRLNSQMKDFSQQKLGEMKNGLTKGDQLYVLENQFQMLTKKVVESQILLKQQAEENTRLIVDNAFDAIITMDQDGTVTSWNPQAEAIFGWKQSDILGQRVVDTIIPSAYRRAHEKGLEHFLETGEGNIFNMQLQITAVHRDGHEFPIELAISPAKRGKSYFFIAIIRDITERKKYEEQIKSSLKEKEVLLSEIHHRVKNNMQIISSLLKLQSDQISDANDLEMIKDSQNRIKSMSLIHEKLYRSKDLSHIDFSDYITDLIRALFRSYGVSSDQIAITVDIKDIMLGIDFAIPCGLIINELVSNSIKHAFHEGTKGEISVSMHKAGEEMLLTVSDNGVGIPDDYNIRDSESLGLKLVSMLSEDQLKGKLDYSITAGTRFNLKFKAVDNSK